MTACSEVCNSCAGLGESPTQANARGTVYADGGFEVCGRCQGSGRNIYERAAHSSLKVLEYSKRISKLMNKNLDDDKL